MQREDEKQTVTFSERVEMKLCMPYTSFTSHLHSSSGMVWYRTLRVKLLIFPLEITWVLTPFPQNDFG